LNLAETPARRLGLKVRIAEVADIAEYEGAFQDRAPRPRLALPQSLLGPADHVIE
jgi:hypothetical protein